MHALELGGGHLYVGTDRPGLARPDDRRESTQRSTPPGNPQDERSYHSLLCTASILYVGSDRTSALQALDPATGAADPGFAP